MGSGDPSGENGGFLEVDVNPTTCAILLEPPPTPEDLSRGPKKFERPLEGPCSSS